jgi:GTP-binding protein
VRKELELHGHKLGEKSEVVVLSKSELTDSEAVRERMERELGRPVLAISAVTGQGLANLVAAVVQQLSELPRE